MTKPVETGCVRCRQLRPCFPYKPIHNCVANAGPVDLVEAAGWIAEIESCGDRWCADRIHGDSQRLLCVPCHDRETTDEEQFLDREQL